MGFGTFSSIKKYRDVYVKGYKRIPKQLLTGKNIILYTGNLICGFDEIPNTYDRHKDFLISCDCEFPEIKEVVKLKTNNKTHGN